MHQPVPCDGEESQARAACAAPSCKKNLNKSKLGVNLPLLSGFAASFAQQHPPAGSGDEIRGVKNSQKTGRKLGWANAPRALN